MSPPALATTAMINARHKSSKPTSPRIIRLGSRLVNSSWCTTRTYSVTQSAWMVSHAPRISVWSLPSPTRMANSRPLPRLFPSSLQSGGKSTLRTNHPTAPHKLPENSLVTKPLKKKAECCSLQVLRLSVSQFSVLHLTTRLHFKYQRQISLSMWEIVSTIRILASTTVHS